MKYQVNTPDLNGKELEYLKECIRTNWISSNGPFVKRFEEEYSKWLGVKHSITTTSGTTALELAIRTLDIPKGKEVIIPAHTMIAVPRAVSVNGLVPVLQDSRFTDRNQDPNLLEDLITKDTKAIIIVHTYGNPVDMDRTVQIARKYGLYLIEDCAEAHGAEYKGKKVGTFGDISIFSFYANKIITTGEGGMLCTDSDDLAERAFFLKNHTFSKERHFWHKEIGYNFRMSNLQAAVGLAQLERVDEFIKKKRDIAETYKKYLDIIEIEHPTEEKGNKNVYWMYGILVDDRDGLEKYLADEGIETRTFFIPIHRQPVYKGQFKDGYPVADYLGKHGLYLPTSVTLKEEEIKWISDKIKRFYENKYT